MGKQRFVLTYGNNGGRIPKKPGKTGVSQNPLRRILGIYTCGFVLMAVMIFGGMFFIYDRSLVWAADGITQHCLSLAYYGEYLRAILRNIFVEHTFHIPMFDFSIGLGADIISTLHYYAIGDPLNLLSVFFKPVYTEYLYSFLVILRMYLAGLTFCIFLSSKKYSPDAVTTGAIAYALTGYSLLAGVRHPFFLTGMVYCPLIFLGIDRILTGKKPLLYIISLAILILSNFYSAYMTCIFMVIYAALRYLTSYRKDGAKHFFVTVGKFALYTVNAFLIPMVIFLPQIENTLMTDRLNTDNAVNLFYAPSYYAGLFNTVTDASSMDEWLVMGFGGVTVLCMIAAFVRIKQYKIVAASGCIGVVLMCFPVFGHILNGFAYVTNRWSWILALIVCAAVTATYEVLFVLSPQEKRRLALFAGLYMLAVFCINRSRTEITMMMLVLLAMAFGLVLGYKNLRLSKKKARSVLSALVAIGVFAQAYYLYAVPEGRYVDQFMLSGEVYRYMVENTSAGAVKELGDREEFSRYDSYYTRIMNDAMLNDEQGTSFFFSTANPNASRFFNEMALNTPFEQQIGNLNNRVMLQYLTGVRYRVGGEAFMKDLYYSDTGLSKVFYNPIGYSDSDNEVIHIAGSSNRAASVSSSLPLYETAYYLPMGYTYDTVMSREQYLALTPAQRQNSLLQTAVTDAVTGLPQAQIKNSPQQIDLFSLLEGTDGIQVQDGKIIVTDADKTLQVTVPIQLDSEVYFSIVGMEYEDISVYDNVRADWDSAQQTAEASEIKALQKRDPLGDKILSNKEYYYSAPRTASIQIVSDVVMIRGSVNYYTPENAFYSGRHDSLVNMGYMASEDIIGDIKEQTLTISFGHEGVYTFDSLMVCNQSLSGVFDDVEVRRQDVLENVVMEDDYVSGTISLDTPKLLATQIPYSEGWRVFVDGEEAELVDVNTMFCGVMLDAGEHTVEFRYATPHWQLAVAMSAAGLVMLLVIALVWRKKHPKAAPAGIAAQPVAESASEESAVSDAAATATQGDAVAPDAIADTSATPDKTAGEEQTTNEA